MALAFTDAGGIEERKQKHLIYSSIRMEINGLYQSDTPPLSMFTFLPQEFCPPSESAALV